MDKERKELLETFKRLDPANRADLLTYIRVAYAAQENTKRQYGIMGPDMPLFNGTRAAAPSPVMEAQT
ncbi:MAG: hypothetical protein LBP74_05735 [Treponema sp.]|jgi:hypothetical protein|nr:hypothetical protein [Treponema sp.]